MAPGQVPESVLKKRKRAEDWATKRAATQSEFKSKAKARRKEIFQRAEKYVKQYRTQVRGAGITLTAPALMAGRQTQDCGWPLQRGLICH